MAKRITEKSPTVIRESCGTISGFQKHFEKLEWPCQPCKEARSIYNKNHQKKNKEAIKAKKAIWRLANKEIIQAKRTTYRKAHLAKFAAQSAKHRKKFPEKVKERKKRYRLENLEKVNAANAKYLKENAERIKERQAIYHQKNRERILKRNREYKAANPEKRRAYLKENPGYTIRHNNRRRARRLGNGCEPYTIQQVLDLWGAICHICEEEIDLSLPRQVGKKGWQRGFHLEHLVPLSRGGSDTLANVKPSHALCNMEKGVK